MAYSGIAISYCTTKNWKSAMLLEECAAAYLKQLLSNFISLHLFGKETLIPAEPIVQISTIQLRL
jgi:hypothetical protein